MYVVTNSDKDKIYNRIIMKQHGLVGAFFEDEIS